MDMGRCKGMLGGVTTVKKCDSQHAGVKVIEKVCQLMERCVYHKEGLTVDKEWDSPQ